MKGNRRIIIALIILIIAMALAASVRADGGGQVQPQAVSVECNPGDFMVNAETDVTMCCQEGVWSVMIPMEDVETRVLTAAGLGLVVGFALCFLWLVALRTSSTWQRTNPQP